MALAAIAGRGSPAEVGASLAWSIALAALFIGIGWPERRLVRVFALVTAAAVAAVALGTRPPDAAEFIPEARAAAAVVVAFGGVIYASAIRAVAAPGPADGTPVPLARTGPYAVVRHPAYLGAALVLASSGVVFGTWAMTIMCAAWVAPVIARTIAEDRQLRERAEYRRYAATVRWRLVPRLW